MTTGKVRWTLCGTRRALWLALVVVLALAPGVQADTSVYLPVATTPPPITRGATVSRVVDGDTIVVSLDCCPCIPTFRVRLLAVDTPERGECYYSEATEATRAMVGGQHVGLERDRSETDGFGRLLRHVYIGDLWVNGALVAQGYAHVMIVGHDTRYSGALYTMQDAARAQGRGGWSACGW